MIIRRNVVACFLIVACAAAITSVAEAGSFIYTIGKSRPGSTRASYLHAESARGKSIDDLFGDAGDGKHGSAQAKKSAGSKQTASTKLFSLPGNQPATLFDTGTAWYYKSGSSGSATLTAKSLDGTPARGKPSRQGYKSIARKGGKRTWSNQKKSTSPVYLASRQKGAKKEFAKSLPPKASAQAKTSLSTFGQKSKSRIPALHLVGEPKVVPHVPMPVPPQIKSQVSSIIGPNKPWGFAGQDPFEHESSEPKVLYAKEAQCEPVPLPSGFVSVLLMLASVFGIRGIAKRARG